MARLLTGLTRAADVVECLDNRELQRSQGWDLANWKYRLVPWGVCFSYESPHRDGRCDVLILTGLEGTRVVVQGRPVATGTNG